MVVVVFPELESNILIIKQIPTVRFYYSIISTEYSVLKQDNL